MRNKLTKIFMVVVLMIFSFCLYSQVFPPPENLFVTETGYATWDAPSGGSTGILAHHNGYDNIGIGTGVAEDWICAARFDAADLVAYYGSSLIAVNIHVRTAEFSYVEINVWEGGSFSDPGTLIYAQDITASVLIENWTNHVLTTPIPLVAGNEYWIGYYIYATDDHPSSVDAGPAVPGKGDWMYYSGIWQEISVAFALDYNWCIEGVVGIDDNILTKNPMKYNLSEAQSTKRVLNSLSAGKMEAAFNRPVRKNNSTTSSREILLGYNVYLDGALVAFTTNLFYDYDDGTLISGQSYFAEVTAVYDVGESTPIDYTFIYQPTTLDPPQNLFVTETGYATWDSSGGGATGILAHHSGYDNNGIGTGGAASWICAARFDTTDLVPYYGSNLTDVNIHICTADFSYVEARVYEGGSFGYAGNLVYAQDITSSVLIEDWTNHVLTTPIPLVANHEYWIGYYIDATGDHPASVDAGPAIPGKGDWMFYIAAWVEISIAYGLDYNWCIEGVVGGTENIRDKTISTKNIFSQPPGSMVTSGIPEAAYNHPKQRYDRASDTRVLLGYNVYLDGVYINFTTNLFWQYTGLTLGVNYTAGVSALYNAGESEIIEYDFVYIDYVEQTIGLLSGWNMISFYNEPVNMDIHAIMQVLIDAGELFKVQDEGGLALVYLPGIGWYNGIGDMVTTEGYYIKVLVDTQLYTIGSLVALPKDIPLITGWNMMSYPMMTSQDGLAVVQPLIDTGDLFKVQNESGLAIVYLPGIGWYNGIGDFLPGEGYYIKVNSDVTLMIIEPVDYVMKKRESIKKVKKQTQQLRETTHFVPNWLNNPYMAMNVFVTSLEIVSLSLKAGDELGIFDGDICVGSSVTEDDAIISLIASTDDPLTEEIDGFIVGNEMSFRFWDNIENIEMGDIDVTETSGDETFASLGTSVLCLEIMTTGISDEPISTVTKLGQNYPNPFNPETTINFSMKESGHVTLEIYNIKGQRVKTLINEFRDAGYYRAIWDGTDDNRILVSSGIYLYKMNEGYQIMLKKMLLVK